VPIMATQRAFFICVYLYMRDAAHSHMYVACGSNWHQTVMCATAKAK